MIRFERPILRNEAGTPDGGGGSAALDAMPDLSTGLGDNWEAIKSQLLGQEGPQQQQTPQGTNADDPWAVEKKESPKPKASSYAERVAQRVAKQQAQTYEQQLQAYQQQLQQATQLQQQQRAEYQRLKAKGDLDGALRALGAEDFATLQREFLTAKGAIPAESADPHVQALQRQIQQLQQERVAQQRAAQQRMAQQREHQQRVEAQRQLQADLQAVTQDLKDLDAELPGAAQFAEIDGFAASVLQILEANPGAQLPDAVKIARRDFEAAYQLLGKAFQPQQRGYQRYQPPQQQQPQQPQRLPSAAAAPLSGFMDETDPGRWEKIKNAAMNG